MTPTTTLILAGVVIIVLETLLVIFLMKSKTKQVRKLKEAIDKKEVENASLEVRLKQKDIAVEAIKEHTSRVALTKRQLQPLKKKIKEAKTDEEAISIVGDIVRRNNAKLLLHDKD